MSSHLQQPSLAAPALLLALLETLLVLLSVLWLVWLLALGALWTMPLPVLPRTPLESLELQELLALLPMEAASKCWRTGIRSVLMHNTKLSGAEAKTPRCPSGNRSHWRL